MLPLSTRIMYFTAPPSFIRFPDERRRFGFGIANSRRASGNLKSRYVYIYYLL